MNHFPVVVLGLAMCVAASTQASDLLMSRNEYNAMNGEIASRYSQGRIACKSLAGNARDVCMQEARGRKKIAQAELLQAYAPSPKHLFDVRMSRANADFALAKERCDDLSANARDLCRKEASRVFVSAKAEATLSETTRENNARAREKAAAVQAERTERNAEATSAAIGAKRAADYDVAREKCESLAGTAKTDWLGDAKRRFGQS